MPNGFNFLVPVTNALATSREYSYQQDNDEQNRTRFEGLGISHEPSPWMGDRNQFSVMPVAGSAAPSGNPHTRALTFSHDNETAQPEYYGVTTDSGIRAEMTPTNRGMVMRFTFRDADARAASCSTRPPATATSPSTPNGTPPAGSRTVRGHHRPSRTLVSGRFDVTPCHRNGRRRTSADQVRDLRDHR